MRRLPLLLLAVFTTGAFPGSAAAVQAPTVPGLEVLSDTSAVQVVRLRDGSTLYGRVLDTGPPVVLRLRDGQVLRLEPASIRDVEALDGRVVNGEVWEADANPSRLFFAPTARTMPAGSGYFAVYELVVPFLSFSLTDRFMIAGGTPIVGGLDDRPFYVAPKFQLIRRERFQLATGAWIIATGDDEVDLLSLLFGIATWGSPDNAVTVGLGYGFEGSRVADNPALVAGFETRVSRRIKLVSENWYLPGDVGLLSLGPRFMGSRLSADVGLGWVLTDDENVLVPLVNFVFTW
ncbi:MAG TPA: hypothetical protein VK858_15485 [Longimicrobiales bacterium]|nr:hypothetical protein [Longimicrobiales bacterium]